MNTFEAAWNEDYILRDVPATREGRRKMEISKRFDNIQIFKDIRLCSIVNGDIIPNAMPAEGDVMVRIPKEVLLFAQHAVETFREACKQDAKA